jgi:hypothetical protein
VDQMNFGNSFHNGKNVNERPLVAHIGTMDT